MFSLSSLKIFHCRAVSSFRVLWGSCSHYSSGNRTFLNMQGFFLFTFMHCSPSKNMNEHFTAKFNVAEWAWSRRAIETILRIDAFLSIAFAPKYDYTRISSWWAEFSPDENNMLKSPSNRMTRLFLFWQKCNAPYANSLWPAVLLSHVGGVTWSVTAVWREKRSSVFLEQGMWKISADIWPSTAGGEVKSSASRGFPGVPNSTIMLVLLALTFPARSPEC